MPHWELTEPEAASVSRASTDVLRHYDIKATQKTIDIVTLMMALGSVYGTRGLATILELRARRAAERAPRTPNGAMPAEAIGIGAIPPTHSELTH